MINRSAIVVGHTPAFFQWLKASGVEDESIRTRIETARKTVYLIPACHYPEEIEEVVEDIFEEIFHRELAFWQQDESLWPDTADSSVFEKLFTVEGFSFVIDLGRSAIEEETAGE